jgi:hypothetical protein
VSAGALASLPALPLHAAGKYVAGAYIVLFAVVLIYVSIMAARLARVQREVDELRARQAPAGGQPRAPAPEPER